MGGVEPGRPWESPTAGEGPRVVEGVDAELAAAWHEDPGSVIAFRPDASSDIARVLGTTTRTSGTEPTAPGDRVVALDGMWCVGEIPPSLSSRPADRRRERLERPVSEFPAIGTVVLGTPPDRLGRLSRSFHVRVAVDGREVFAGKMTTVVVASGEFLRGADLVPRGHPGDGRLEVQVYTLERRQRKVMRERLATAGHLPHPGILERSGRRVEVTVPTGSWPLEADAVPRAPVSGLEVTVLPGAVRLAL
ncbi:MAG: hypothetical protein R3A49_02820 [Acidimicrobiia bacterium]